MEQIQNYQQNQEHYQSIKPAIKTSLLLLSSFGLTIIIYFLVGLFLTAPLMFVFSLFGAGGIVAGLVSVIILFSVIMFIVFLFKRASLRRTEYKFYSNKVEYYEGFLVKNRKTINYDRITNIGQRKGIIEGLFGLGTVFIDTAGSSAKGHELSMRYLENPDQTYYWISNVTNKKQ